MQQAAEARYSAVYRGGAARSPGLRGSTELSRSSLEADPEYLLAIERQQRQLLDVRLHAQMDANDSLRRDNLELASRSAATSRQLRAALRSRDELRNQAAEVTALDDAVRAAVSRRSLQAAQALCASLRTRVYALEGQVAQLQSAAWRNEAARCGVELPPLVAYAAGGGVGTSAAVDTSAVDTSAAASQCLTLDQRLAPSPCGVDNTPWGGLAIPDTPRSRSPRRLSPPASSPPASPAGSPGASVHSGMGSGETTRSRPPRRAAPPASTPDGVSMCQGGGADGGGCTGGSGSGGGGGGSGREGASSSPPDAVPMSMPTPGAATLATPDAAILASFAGSLSAGERQVLLNLDAAERTAVLRELLALAAGLPSQG